MLKTQSDRRVRVSFFRPRNAATLPPGWYLSGVSVLAIRGNDEIHVVLTARRRSPKS
jgi:hypothetical protein